MMRYFIIGLISLTVLQSCAKQTVYDVASSVWLKHSAKVSRQRHLVVSPLSHIGLYINAERVRSNVENNDNPLLPIRLGELNKGLNHAVYRQFVEVTELDKARSVNRNIDFIIEAHILKMTLTEKTVIETPVSELDTESLGVEKHEEVFIPMDYLDIKLLLKDARSNQVIDISYLAARSGQLDYEAGYANFADYSIEQYLKNITRGSAK